MPFVSFPSIVNFHTVRKMIVRNKPIVHDQQYKAKIKLHGTNGGIVIAPNGRVAAQSRTQIIGTGNDNVGFAQWVEGNAEHWAQRSRSEQVTVFGEWCGPSIQKGTAINLIPERIFAVFAIQLGIHEGEDDYTTRLIVDPNEIRSIVGSLPNMYVLDWYEPANITVNFFNRDLLSITAKQVNEILQKIEPCDPWVEENFGVKGISEGLVYYPITTNTTRWHFTTLGFKVKGQQHKVYDAEPMAIDVPIAAGAKEYVELVVTEARLEQGVTEATKGKLEAKYIGPFLAWVAKDIKKEAGLELVESGLSWKQVSPLINAKARHWFSERTRNK